MIAYFATVKDISERKRLEGDAQESEQRWRSIVEDPFDYVSLIDRDYRFLYVNHVSEGLALEDVVGKATPLDFVDDANREILRSTFDRTFETGLPTSYDAYSEPLDRWYSTVVGPIRAKDKAEERVRELGVATTLAKPFLATELQEAIERTASRGK